MGGGESVSAWPAPWDSCKFHHSNRSPVNGGLSRKGNVNEQLDTRDYPNSSPAQDARRRYWELREERIVRQLEREETTWEMNSYPARQRSAVSS
jgi:hypothetical protein